MKSLNWNRKPPPKKYYYAPFPKNPNIQNKKKILSEEEYKEWNKHIAQKGALASRLKKMKVTLPKFKFTEEERDSKILD